MPETIESSGFEASKLLSLMSTSRKKFKEEFKNYDKSSVEKLYSAISKEIFRTISTANFKDFEKLIKLTEYIKNSGDNLAQDHFHRSIYEPMKNSNFIIVACKYNQVSVLEYLFDNPKVINLFKNDDKNFLKPDDIDEERHNAFYYAVRSGNCKLIETLINKWPHQYCPLEAENCCYLLAQSYEELKLKFITLSDDVKIYVESFLIDYRFYFDSSKNKSEIIKISHGDIKQRIDLILDNIKLLVREYSDVNEKFYYITRFISQNIHILKRQLKSMYNKLPWEEIEFCMIAFISNEQKYETQSKVIYNYFLTKEKLLDYLYKFGVALENEKNNIDKLSVKELTILPNVQRKNIVTLIIEKHPEFKDLYDEYQHLRDTHSLEVINEYLDLALSANPKEREGQLIIIRALQIMGEHLKNTLESPNMSLIISDMLLSSLPINTRKLINDLRNSLSHRFSAPQRLQLETNADNYFFTNLQQDVKVMNRIVVSVLYQTRFQHIAAILKKIINCQDADQVRRVLEIFHFDFKKWLTYNKDDESQQITEWIEELNCLIHEDNKVGKKLLDDIKRIITTEFTSKNNEFDVFAKMGMIDNIRSMMNKKHIDANALRGFKFRSEEMLSSMPSNMSNKSGEKIKTLFFMLFGMIQSTLSSDDFFRAYEIMNKIMYRLGSDTKGMQWVEEFRDKIGKQYDNLNNKNEEFNYGNKKQNKINKLNEDYIDKISMLQSIFNDNQLNNFSVFKNNKKLQVTVEMLLLDVLSILNEPNINILTGNRLFLDNNSPILIGKNLRNHLAHGNDIVKIMQFDPTIAVFLNAKKLIAGNVIESKRKVGKVTPSNLENLKKKYEQEISIIDNQKDMFRALEQGDLEKLKETLKRGADINGKSCNSWTALHYAAKGPNIEVVKFVLDKNVSPQMTNGFNQSVLHVAAEYGRKLAVELLIKNKCNVNALDDEGQSPLHKAAENGHEEIVKILMKNNADTSIQNSYGYSALHNAVLNNHKSVVEILLKRERHVNLNEAAGGFTMLHLAAELGHTDIVEYLVKYNANVNKRTHQNATPLHGAALNGHLDVVKVLISHGADIHAVTVSELTALHNAVETNREEIVELLLQRGANVNARGPVDNFAAINYTAEKGYSNMLKLLIKYNAEVNISTSDGRTPLHIAAFNGHVDIIDILIKNRISIDFQSKDGSTPLCFASAQGHDHVLKFLLKNGASTEIRNFQNLTSLHIAALQGHKKCVEVLLDWKADIRARTVGGKTALHLSSQSGHLDTTELLITRGANINEKDSLGLTALHDASCSGEVKIVEILIKAGANINLLDFSGSSPLKLAILQGHTEIVEYFINNELDINYEQLNYESLEIALNHNYQAIAKMIIEKNTSINFRNEQGHSLLYTAAKNNQIDIIKLLLKLGARVKIGNSDVIVSAVFSGHKNAVHTLITHGNININEKLKENMSLLQLAVINDHKNIAELLLEKGADVNAVCPDGTSLHLAASKGHYEMIKLLLDNNADSSIKDDKNRTAIEMALNDSHDHIRSFKILFEHKKIDVNYRCNNDEEWTLLHIAAQAGSLPITEYLIEKGADINLQNKHFSKPVHIAAREGHKHLVEYYINKNIDLYDRGAAGWTLLHYASFGKGKDVINYLFDKNFDVNIIDLRGQTPLHVASEYGSKDIVEILLRNGASYDSLDIFKKKPSQIAGDTSIVDLFKCIDKLFKAVKQNNVKETEFCVKQKAIINTINSDRVTALHYSAWKGYTEIVEILLNNEANPNIVNKNDSTPLHYAAKFGYPEIVKILLNNGAIYNAKTKKGNTPLELATHPEIIKLLKLINRSFISVENGSIKIIDELKNVDSLDTLKSIMNAQNSEGKTLIVTAINRKFIGTDDLKEISLGDCMYWTSEFNKMMIHEKYQEALNLCNSVLERRKKILGSDDPGILDIKYSIALIIYKQQNYQKALDMCTEIYEKQKQILGPGDSYSLRTNCIMAMALHRLGRNPEALVLFEETYEKQKKILSPNDEELIKTQIQMGLVLMNLQKYDQALLCYKNALEKIRKTDVYNILVIQNNIALVYNLQNKYDEALEMYQNVYELRRKLLGPNHSDTLRAMFNKILVLAAQEKYSDALAALEKLLTSQTKALGPNHIDTLTTKLKIGDIYFHQRKFFNAFETYTSIKEPMTSILGSNHPQLILLKGKIEGIQMSYQSSGDARFLNYCKKNTEISEVVKCKESVDTLLKSGFNINAKDSSGLTLLHYAVNNEDESIVKFLLKNNADCCAISSKGNTALHFAVIKNNRNIVSVLLEHAKRIMKNCELHEFINSKTKKGGMTCMHVAAQKGFEDIVVILLKYGAIYDGKNLTDKKTPYDLCNNDSIKILLNLIDDFFKDAKNGNDLLVIKLRRLDVEKYTAILNARNTNSETLINVALSQKHKILARKLLETLKNKF
ncbi:uncharacterized protein LOC130666094 [Microplitis mediator]|uniref:uncharacterized protein LOC130666094 n=1 Tax=Microplitis mediator TaxID=375433 RepID=UPI002557322C|nr:uncharacterized protein LOC130666094 [Microplitis mediator]XP_057322750.1 uncharacterized protein LOC130666094 [Microplitis mediator]XP_057322751.1 uncharacterized protein LOC130666094 [Microplitis mediator]